MRILIVTDAAGEAHALSGQLHERTQSVSWSCVENVDQARRELANGWFDVVLLRPGPKALSLRSFLGFVRALPKQPRLVLIGADSEGATRVEDGAADHVIDQLLGVLGLTRSAIHDHEIVEVLEHGSPFELNLVRVPGSSEILLRGSSSRELDADELVLAQRAAAVRGVGIPEVIEAFWDDPRPHLFYAAPPGVSLLHARKVAAAMDRDTALAVLHGVVVGVATMHAAGVGAGVLGPGRVWLGERGEVLLAGNGFAQLAPAMSRFTVTVSGAYPPEEGRGIPPSIPGDAFRLGQLLHVLVGGGQPFAKLDFVSYMQGAWPPFSQHVRDALGDAVAILEMTLRSSDTERPRGELLRDEIARYAPANAAALVTSLVRLTRAGA